MAYNTAHKSHLSYCPLLSLIVFTCLPLVALSSQAAELEITPMLGYTFSPDLISGDNISELSVSNKANFSLALAWQEATTKQRKSQGQGQVLINYVKRDFNDTSNQSHDFSTLYAHFNGVTFMQESSYTTTIGFGIGAAYIDGESDSAIYPSVTASIGTRHQLSANLNLITEVRAYASLVKDNDNLFCQADDCFAYFNDTLWFDSNVSIGLAYRF